MREIRTYGSEGGGAARSPYPYQIGPAETGFRFRGKGEASHTLRVRVSKLLLL